MNSRSGLTAFKHCVSLTQPADCGVVQPTVSGNMRRTRHASGKAMIKEGTQAGYWVVAWSDGFDPSLDDLLPHLPEVVVGRRVRIASFDSGQLEPTQEELDRGWSVQGGQAVSPPVQDASDLPTAGFDEWYVYEGDVPGEHHKAFVNRFGFSPLDPASMEVDEFWDQVKRFQPLHVLGAGTPIMFLVTRDEKTYARAVALGRLP